MESFKSLKNWGYFNIGLWARDVWHCHKAWVMQKNSQGFINRNFVLILSQVRCHYRFWNHMYRKYFSRYANYLVHDEENFCRLGDKVVIRASGGPVSKLKHYYVRNVVKQFPRNDYYIIKPESTIESKNEYHQLYKNFLEHEMQRKIEEEQAKKDAKSKALDEAEENLKLLERAQMDAKTKKLERKKSHEKRRVLQAERKEKTKIANKKKKEEK